ncbi:MAG: shikimate dehydrogenase [bacterium]
MDHYAVLGNPVKHSQSPYIHQQFAQQCAENIHYEALEAPLDGFPGFVDQLGEKGYLGMNVTVPFKEQAWQLCASRSQSAERAGAVNTLIKTEQGWHGDNTDGTGLLRDLQQNAGLSLKGKRILLLGAGGAVKGVLLPLLSAEPVLLHIANRTASKASALAADFQDEGNLAGSGYDFFPESSFDIVINGTAASLTGEVPHIPDRCLSSTTHCYDMMYSSTPTAFLAWCAERGATTRDGLGMLVEQAAESFYLWQQVRPDTAPVLCSLRDRLGR